MVIIKFQGGLGNQMFQYALYRKLQLSGKAVFADVSRYHQENERNWDLCKFGLKVMEADADDIKRLNDCQRDFISRVRRKIWVKRSCYKEKENGRFFPEVLKNDNVYLDGYWQTEKYFSDIRGQIINDFSFFDFGTDSEKIYENLIDDAGDHSVSIHIRRGDYCNHIMAPIYGGICTLDYYKCAIQFIMERVENPVFFVFSNDIQWVKDNLKGIRCTYVEGNKEETGIIDLKLMSKCRHHILANSSFSWWGAYLSTTGCEQFNIAPDTWMNNLETPDIWCQNWIKVGGRQGITNG